MKVATKAVLLSALIFPGLGHLVLRPRRAGRGLVFLLPAAVAVLYLLRSVMQISDQLMNELNNGTLAFDPTAIIARTDAVSAADPLLNWISVVLFVCWIGAVVDVLWLSRRVQP
ncbi:hypothetical protein GJ699_12505 [Duganella sp. FT80W]|uniref:Uncharacterized protein n=1 Tax=Duganella guangzhouensis TaxID=2666084 RepID=A0A6I2KZ55_9BURK|nr:hypothetical protein [Duganella guangzhouensis]MRW90812.1 hypothetical protein [Duganella guangzhouensis]